MGLNWDQMETFLIESHTCLDFFPYLILLKKTKKKMAVNTVNGKKYFTSQLILHESHAMVNVSNEIKQMTQVFKLDYFSVRLVAPDR